MHKIGVNYPCQRVMARDLGFPSYSRSFDPDGASGSLDAWPDLPTTDDTINDVNNFLAGYNKNL